MAVMGATPARVGSTQRRRSITRPTGAESDVYECLLLLSLLLSIIISLYISAVCTQKKKDRRCEDPPPKETVLDPVYRYHTSVIADPFEILGVEKPPVNVTVC